jgi:hypothetical protein
MKILVTGSRTFPSRELVEKVLEHWNPGGDVLVIVGDCPTGADLYAREWCAKAKVPCQIHYADWDKHGKPAGPIRNREMVEQEPDIVLAFYHGASRGTQNCVNLASKAGISVDKYYA